MAGNFNMDRLFRRDETDWELGWAGMDRAARYILNRTTTAPLTLQLDTSKIDERDLRLIDLFVEIPNKPHQAECGESEALDDFLKAMTIKKGGF